MGFVKWKVKQRKEQNVRTVFQSLICWSTHLLVTANKRILVVNLGYLYLLDNSPLPIARNTYAFIYT